MATNENLQLLLTKLMTHRFCNQEASNLEACIENFVPQATTNSYVDQSLQRRGLKKCAPYSEAAKKCMSDPAKQNAVMRAAALVPQCKKEQLALRRCQRVQGRDCEAEALNTVYCGMVYLSQRLRQQERQSEEPTATS